MSDEAVAILTTESKGRILSQGGSQYWVVNRAVARTKAYVVLVRNAKNPDADARERHGAAFLVGRIAGIVPQPESERLPEEKGDRWKVQIGEYAEVAVPDAWGASRNPVRYTTLREIGIDPASLEFKPVPPASAPAPAGLTIQEAKEALARTFGVSPDSIEITIRA